jgi:hypothetical protein
VTSLPRDGAIRNGLKMVIKHKVEGFGAFVSEIQEITENKSMTVIVLFSGSKDENGKVQ